MEPKTIGPYFGYVYRYPAGKAPLINLKGWTREVEQPFRYGNAWLLRVPASRWALVVGRWAGSHQHEEQALASALDGRSLPTPAEEIRLWR